MYQLGLQKWFVIKRQRIERCKIFEIVVMNKNKTGYWSDVGVSQCEVSAWVKKYDYIKW